MSIGDTERPQIAEVDPKGRETKPAQTAAVREQEGTAIAAETTLDDSLRVVSGIIATDRGADALVEEIRGFDSQSTDGMRRGNDHGHTRDDS